MTSNGLGAKYANINWDHPESACMDIKEVQRCGLPTVIVTASRIYDVYVPPINPPAGDAIGLDPGFYDVTPEQERRQKLAGCKSKANDDLKICLDDAGYHRGTQFADCEQANSIQYTFVRVGGSIVRRLGGKAKGLLPGYEELAPYVGQNCQMNHDSNLRSNRDSCNHKKERETIICEAVYGN